MAADDALAAAQAELAALVRERRGPSCTQSLPFFVYRPRLHSPHASGGLTSQPPFKYLDYFESVGDEGRPVRTVEEALALLDGGDLRPRFTLGRLLHFARRYVEAFPFDAVCDRFS